MGIGAVQRRAALARGVGHAQHAAQQLFHGGARTHVLQRTQHVGERAVPAFAQCVDGDDMAHQAAGVEQVHTVQPALVAGGDNDLGRRGMAFVYQVLAQHVRRDFAALVLRLKQHDGPQGARLFAGLAFQMPAAQHRVAHSVWPALMFGQHHRQLDHVFGLQLARADAVQQVGLARHRRGRQLQNGAGRHALQRFEGGVGLGVVGLVHHHQRPRQRQQVGQRMFDAADVCQLQKPAAVFTHIGGRHLLQRVQRRRRHAGAQVRKVRVEIFAEGIHIAALRVLDAKALHGGHQHDGFGAQVLRRDGGRGVQVQHQQRLPVHGFQCAAQGVAGLAQGRQRLVADGGRRHQPQRQRKIGPPPGACHQWQRVRSQQRFAAAGGYAQAHAGCVAEGLAAVGGRGFARAVGSV